MEDDDENPTPCARFRRLFRVLGTRFTLITVLIEHVLQGFVFGGGTGGFVGVPILFLLRSYGTLTASRIQILRTIAISPWALKPLFGLVSDLVYVVGFRKLPFIFVTLLGAVAACVALATLWPLSPIAATLLFFAVFMQIGVADLLLEAQYAKRTAEALDVRPDLVSFVDGFMTPPAIASLLITGLMIDHVPLQDFYLFAIPFFLLTVAPVYQNWLEDEDYVRRYDAIAISAESDFAPSHEQDNRLCNACWQLGWYTRRDAPTDGESPVPLIGVDTRKARRSWRLVLLALIIGLISLATGFIGLLELSSLWVFLAALAATPLMIGAFFLLADAQVARIQTFVILSNACSFSIESAAFFFYTDSPVAYPEGPHFSAFFYVTVMGSVTAVLSLLGVLTYNLLLRRWRIRSILLFANLIYVVPALLNVAFLLRWNRAIGIPDWLFILGGDALLAVFSQWSAMPCKVMMLQLCPDGMEATVYALQAGSSNLGYGLSQYVGAFVLDTLGVKPTGAPNESAQFEWLWLAALLSVLLSLFPLLFIRLLIPDAKQTDSLLGEPMASNEEEIEMTDHALHLVSSDEEATTTPVDLSGQQVIGHS